MDATADPRLPGILRRLLEMAQPEQPISIDEIFLRLRPESVSAVASALDEMEDAGLVSRSGETPSFSARRP